MTSALAASVVIPVKDDRRIAACLASIREAMPPGMGIEIVVVDNGSAAEFSAWLMGVAAGSALLLSAPEPGVYRARNVGVQAARGGVIFFTDADCVVLPGWFEEGLRFTAGGYDIVQGFSGTTRRDRVSRLLQARYEARFRRLAPGEATEVDTRNLAVRREVFERLTFNEAYRRVGDTEFGLVAERLGFRVGYAPGMRVDHDHDDDLRVFAAKQVCHGWGAQRLMRTCPGLAWHGGHLRLVGRVTRIVEATPAGHALGRLLAAAAFAEAGVLQRVAGWFPLAAGRWWLTAIDKQAGLAGHLLYRPGTREPSPSGLLGRRLARD